MNEVVLNRSNPGRSSYRNIRVSNNFNPNRPERKKSAAERLEADKMKYVKSAHVRQKRITAASISPTSITTTPTEEEEDEKRGSPCNNNVITATSSGSNSSGEVVVKPPRPKPRTTFENAHKAKEALRPVVQQHQQQNRQSRASRTQTVVVAKPRSVSVGPNVRAAEPQQHHHHQQLKKHLSPRTQLKNAREGLKKIKSDHRFGLRRPDQLELKPFADIQPNVAGNHLKKDQLRNGSDNTICVEERGRSASVSTSGNQVQHQSYERCSSNKDKEEESGKLLLQSDREKLNHFDAKKQQQPTCATVGQGRQRKSWASHKNTTNNPPTNQQHQTATNKVTRRHSNHLSAVVNNNNPSPAPNNVSSHHEGNNMNSSNRPGSRKSISERLEEILTPLDDKKVVTMMDGGGEDIEEMDTTPAHSNQHGNQHNNNRYLQTNSRLMNSSNNNTTTTTAVAANHPTPGVVRLHRGYHQQQQDHQGRVDQVPNHHKPPVASGTTSGANHHKPPVVSGTTSGATNRGATANLMPPPPVPVSAPKLAPKTRREVAPSTNNDKSNRRHNLRNHHQNHHQNSSPVLMSKCRGGVVTSDVNTISSHNTTSSSSADATKPLTALTASDLKPRRLKRNGEAKQQQQHEKPTNIISGATPVRANHPYPTSSHHNHHHGNQQLVRNRQVVTSTTTPPHSPLRTSAHRNSHHHHNNNPVAQQRCLQDRTDQAKLNSFFTTMGGYMPSIHSSNENSNSFNNLNELESNFSFAGASAYVREDEMEVDEGQHHVINKYHQPAVSIIEKNARIMKWIKSCRSQLPNNNHHHFNNHHHHAAGGGSSKYHQQPKESCV